MSCLVFTMTLESLVAYIYGCCGKDVGRVWSIRYYSGPTEGHDKFGESIGDGDVAWGPGDDITESTNIDIRCHQILSFDPTKALGIC